MPQRNDKDRETHVTPSNSKMSGNKKASVSIPFIEGLRMDWMMNDGLFARFCQWRLGCNLILESEYADVTETQKVNTLLRWTGKSGLKKLESWQKDTKDLTLAFVWDEFENYCKPQVNKLRAHYDLLQLRQNGKPCDDWFTVL